MNISDRSMVDWSKVGVGLAPGIIGIVLVVGSFLVGSSNNFSYVGFAMLIGGIFSSVLAGIFIYVGISD